jgi:hypothetical protein
MVESFGATLPLCHGFRGAFLLLLVLLLFLLLDGRAGMRPSRRRKSRKPGIFLLLLLLFLLLDWLSGKEPEDKRGERERERES